MTEAAVVALITTGGVLASAVLTNLFNHLSAKRSAKQTQSLKELENQEINRREYREKAVAAYSYVAEQTIKLLAHQNAEHQTLVANFNELCTGYLWFDESLAVKLFKCTNDLLENKDMAVFFADVAALLRELNKAVRELYGVSDREGHRAEDRSSKP